jgi:hypothetical protein
MKISWTAQRKNNNKTHIISISMIIYLMTLVTTKNVMMTTRLLATGCFNEDIMMRDHTLIGLISNCLMSNLTRLESDFASFLCMMLHVPKE